MKSTSQKLKSLEATPPWEWPDDARSVLLEVLRDRGAAVADRILAAELAGEAGTLDDALAKALADAVRGANEPDELRQTAAIALGPTLELCDTDGFDPDDDLGEPPISERTFEELQRTLRAVYEDPATPKQVRRRVLEGAVRASADWHAGAIRTAYASDDPDWRLTAVFGMRFVEGFDEQILASLTNPDTEVQAEAVRAAGEWQLAAAAPHVLRLLSTKKIDKDLLLAAITAVAMVSPARALEVLPRFEASDDPDIAEAAEEATHMASIDWDRIGEAEEEDDDLL